MSLQAEDEQANMARVQISTSLCGNADLLSPHKQILEDGDSGFHELIDDAAAFELMAVQSPAPPASHVLSAEGRHTSSTSTGSLLSPLSASPISGTAERVLADEEGREAAVPVARSASSTGSAATQPDVGAVEEAGREGEGDSGLLSPSPTGSEEDVSGKESDDAFEDTGHSSPSEDELGEHWNPDFYTLQSQAPKPILVPCTKEVLNRPAQYGKEYHGVLSREDAADLLGNDEGCYLVREGHGGEPILSFTQGGRMWNFRLYYEENSHFVGEKHFEDISELVQDGLITLFLAQHNVMQAMERGRNVTRVQSQRLRRQPCRRVKGPKGKSKSAYLERLRFTSFDSPPPTPRTIRQMSSPNDLVPMTPNSNKQQSDLDLTLLSERRGESTSALTTPTTSTPDKKVAERRTRSTECLQKMHEASKRRYSPVLALRDAVRADRESLSQSVDISVLSEKAASILGIAPPKQFKRASMYDPLLEQRIETETIPSRRSHSFHPSSHSIGLKKTRSQSQHFDKVTSLPRDLQRYGKKPPAYPYYKAHKFKPVTYVHPTWCVICHHFLWGLKMQGLRCQDCGIDIHRQCCAGSLDHECNPTKKVVKRVFGVDLTTLLKVEESKIPTILQECIRHIESTDLAEEGLYRISGQTSEVLDLKEKVDHQEKVDLSQYSDINVISGAVKLYLRELPIPVVTFDAYTEVMKATSSISDPSDPDVDWTPLADALKLLPKAHYNVLKYLVDHLHKVDQNSAKNKMTAYNLAVVFAPTLMRSPSEDLSLIKDLPLQRHFVELLILKHDDLFN